MPHAKGQVVCSFVYMHLLFTLLLSWHSKWQGFHRCVISVWRMKLNVVEIFKILLINILIRIEGAISTGVFLFFLHFCVKLFISGMSTVRPCQTERWNYFHSCVLFTWALLLKVSKTLLLLHGSNSWFNSSGLLLQLLESFAPTWDTCTCVKGKLDI